MDETKEELPALEKWQGRIELAKIYQEQFGDTDGRWKKYVRALAGDFNSQEMLGEEAVDVNLVHANEGTLLPPLWLTEPFIMVKPTQKWFRPNGDGARGPKYDNTRRSEFCQAELNYWFKELKVRESVRRCIYDARCTNHGYLYIGKSKDVEVTTAEGGMAEPIPEIRAGRPFIRRLSPRNVLVPPGAGTLEEHPWVCILWLKHVEDVKRIWPTTTKDLKPTKSVVSDPKREANGALRELLASDDTKMVEVQQIWDKRTKKLITLADGHKKIIEEADWPWDLEGFPLAHLSPTYVPDEYWATPPIQFYYPQQLELNAARTATRTRENRSRAMVYIDKELEEEVSKAQAASKGEGICYVPLDGKDIRQVIQTDPGLPPRTSAYAYGNVQIQDAFLVTGLGPQQRSSGDPNIGSATESANVEKWAIVRSSDLGDQVRTFYLDAARKLYQLLLGMPKKKRRVMAAQIGGELAGAQAELTYSSDEIKGEFGFDMDLSSFLADNPTVRQQYALANYNLLRADPKVDADRLIFDVFASQGKTDPESYMETLRTPEEEFILFAQGMPVEANERDDHPTHYQAHEAQVDRLNQMLDQVGDPDSTEGRKIRMAIMLLIANANQHAMFMQQIAGPTAGKPIAENMLRSSMAAPAGPETAAEISGQPLTADSLAPTPGGVPMPGSR